MGGGGGGGGGAGRGRCCASGGRRGEGGRPGTAPDSFAKFLNARSVGQNCGPGYAGGGGVSWWWDGGARRAFRASSLGGAPGAVGRAQPLDRRDWRAPAPHHGAIWREWHAEPHHHHLAGVDRLLVCSLAAAIAATAATATATAAAAVPAAAAATATVAARFSCACAAGRGCRARAGQEAACNGSAGAQA